MSAPGITPYGTWESPISAELIASGSISLNAVAFSHPDGELYWRESRPTEGGRYVIARRGAGGEIEVVTPPETNVRTLVHEYGGANYTVRDGLLLFSDFADQRLYRQDRGDDPIAITPDPSEPRGLRYADPQLSPDGRTIVCIRERHDDEGRGSDATNELVVFSADGSGEATIIASGRDFYAYPRISPDGTRIAWTEWDHPNMPWDGAELKVADLANDGSLSNVLAVAGGADESVVQPEWSPDGVLHFISDRTGWWNLYRWEPLPQPLSGAERGDQVVALAPMDEELGGPQWSLDAAWYGFLSCGRIACVVTTRGIDRLGVIEPGSGVVREIETPFTAFASIATDDRERIAVVAGGPTTPSSVALIDAGTGQLEIVRRSMGAEIDPGYLSPPQPIEFPTTGGRTAHALYYAPRNGDYQAPDGELPPLVVFSHGGPTSRSSAEMKLMIQFWTSRGIAVVDVNYGGSTGYGREYRQRLNGNWGIVDIDDCVNAALYLAEQGLADRQRMAIRGGSAGGYTTLGALTFRDVFAAGASYYGVADLEGLAKDTHKFESRYLDSVVGPYPEQRERYIERSPVHHVDRLSTPMILFQGLEDKVVPPSQAEAMVTALREKGLPHAYVPYEGEQHGFRHAENIRHSLEAELSFYAQIFGFDPAGEIERVRIENL